MLPVSLVRPVAVNAPDISARTPAKQEGFQNILANAIERVEASRADAEQTTHAFLTGDNQELHSVALSVQRAEMELELALQVRNKAVQAYQEIMRMQM